MESFDINKAPFEIERRFLIEYPDTDRLRAMPGYHSVHMEQSYLSASEGFIGGRVRSIEDENGTRYVYTYKLRLTDMRRREFEKEISEEEYLGLLVHKTPGTITISKDRHIFSYGGLVYELDVYSFWDDKATLEAEVESESTPIPIPPCVRLIKEVTDDRRYNNSQLAKNRGVIEAQ